MSPTSTSRLRWVGRCSTNWSVTARGRCLRPRCRPRSPPTLTPTQVRSTGTVCGWWSATATTRSGQWLGSTAGLSAATITRLTGQWQDDAAAFGKQSLTGTDYVYCWVDGIHLKVRLAQDKVCLLVMIGVRADGTKELVAVSDGFRESSESWADLLRDCKRRGMRLAQGSCRRGARHPCRHAEAPVAGWPVSGPPRPGAKPAPDARIDAGTGRRVRDVR